MQGARRITVASLILAAQIDAAAPRSTPLKFAATLGDEMVLQSSPAEAIVWGPLGSTASAVSVSWHQQVAGGGSGSPEEKQPPPVDAKIQDWLGLKIWTAKLPPVRASFDRYTITASPNQGAPASIANVTFGEVWLCSGQSNMGYTIAGDTHCFNRTRNADGTPNCSKEVQERTSCQMILHFPLMSSNFSLSPTSLPEHYHRPQTPAGGLCWCRRSMALAVVARVYGMQGKRSQTW